MRPAAPQPTLLSSRTSHTAKGDLRTHKDAETAAAADRLLRTASATSVTPSSPNLRESDKQGGCECLKVSSPCPCAVDGFSDSASRYLSCNSRLRPNFTTDVNFLGYFLLADQDAVNLHQKRSAAGSSGPVPRRRRGHRKLLMQTLKKARGPVLQPGQCCWRTAEGTCKETCREVRPSALTGADLTGLSI